MIKKTIFALSTNPGKSALAIIRISGPQAYNTIQKISSSPPTKSNVATLNNIIDTNGEVIDQTITTFYKSPKSFTGEDLIEIILHGGNAVIKKTISIISSFKNTRIANPGEFTRRAFENNKLDLTQVEAISDLVNAETEMQRQQAIHHLSGKFFVSTKKMFDSLKMTLANLEAIIDFSEEDLPQNLLNKIKEQIRNNILLINEILKGSSFGVSIREGFLVTLIGKTNTGKSSFINNISGKDVAIVTRVPGTTRDLIESFLDISGYPIKFIDTAGIRESKDIVEKIGIKKALKTSKESNLNIVFINNPNEIKEFNNIKDKIFVKSKQDLSKKTFKDKGFYNISSKSNFGIQALLDIVIKKIKKTMPNEKSYISRERHVSCLKSVKKHLLETKKQKNIDLLAEDVRLAVKELETLFGTVDIEEILDIIFADFCIGK